MSRTRLALLISAIPLAGMISPPPAANAQGSETPPSGLSRLLPVPPSPGGAAPAREAGARKMTARDAFEHLLKATALIACGEGENVTLGTAWVLDARRRLMITNHHVVEGFEAGEVYFPAYEDGRLVHEMEHYARRVRPVRAEVIDVDPVRDLALLRVGSLPEGAVALELAAESASAGDVHYTLAGFADGDGGLWGFTKGEARLVTRRKLANGHVVRALVSTAQTNRGNSGGAIVNEYGKVVAVCEGHLGPVLKGDRIEDVRGVSMFVDVTELRAYLDEALPLLEPRTAAQFLARGRRRLGHGRHDAAAADLTRAARLDPDRAEAYALRGYAWWHKKDLTTALADFDAALRLAPDNFEALLGRGGVHADLGEYDKAVADLTGAIRLDPASGDAYNRRGDAHYLAGRYALAEGDYTRALKFGGPDAAVFLSRCIARVALGRHKDALVDAAESVRLDPSHARAWNYRGLCQYHLKEFAGAAETFLKAIELDPNQSVYFHNLGDTLQELGRHDLAVKALTEAIRLDPRCVDSYGLRGISLRELDRLAEALKDFDRAIELDGNRAALYAQRALTLSEMGRTEEARADAERAARLDPETYRSLLR